MEEIWEEWQVDIVGDLCCGLTVPHSKLCPDVWLGTLPHSSHSVPNSSEILQGPAPTPKPIKATL